MTRPNLRVVDGPPPDDWSDDLSIPKADGEGSDRTFDLDAEGAVLSNCIFDPAAIGDVKGLLRPEFFFSERHRRIFAALVELFDSHAEIDYVAIATKLRADGQIATIGGLEYLIELIGAAPVLLPRILRAHAMTVRQLWVRREFATFARLQGVRCDSESSPIDRIMLEARSRIDELATIVAAAGDSSSAGAVLRDTLRGLERAGETSGLGARPCGFDRVDRVTAGLHVELTMLGARPGMGKTSLATAIGVNVAARGEGVLIASLETVREELMTRILCAEAGVDLHRVRTGATTAMDWSRITEASARIDKLPLWIDDTSGMTVTDLWAKARQCSLALSRTGRKLGLVVVDYVQLLKAARPGMKREEVVGENARGLKAMAQDLGVTVLGLAQLNREVDKRSDKHPQLSDLRESGELEQCARTVLLLYREDYYQKRRAGYRPNGIVEVHVAKQNNGPTGIVHLGFDESYTRFRNLGDGQ